MFDELDRLEEAIKKAASGDQEAIDQCRAVVHRVTDQVPAAAIVKFSKFILDIGIAIKRHWGESN